jgi:hypothetical protein
MYVYSRTYAFEPADILPYIHGIPFRFFFVDKNEWEGSSWHVLYVRHSWKKTYLEGWVRGPLISLLIRSFWNIYCYWFMTSIVQCRAMNFWSFFQVIILQQLSDDLRFREKITAWKLIWVWMCCQNFHRTSWLLSVFWVQTRTNQHEGGFSCFRDGRFS